MEDKTLNFTTQNSFLHYGVKGMKWGVITSEYEPVGKKSSSSGSSSNNQLRGYAIQPKAANNKRGVRARTAGKQYSNDYEGQSQRMQDEYDEATKQMQLDYDTSVVDMYEHNVNTTHEIMSDFVNKVENASAPLYKYDDALTELQSMDDKFTVQFYEKYKNNITKALNDYNSVITKFIDKTFKNDPDAAEEFKKEWLVKTTPKSNTGVDIRSLLYDAVNKKEELVNYIENDEKEFINSMYKEASDSVDGRVNAHARTQPNPNYSKNNKYDNHKKGPSSINLR